MSIHYLKHSKAPSNEYPALFTSTSIVPYMAVAFSMKVASSDSGLQMSRASHVPPKDCIWETWEGVLEGVRDVAITLCPGPEARMCRAKEKPKPEELIGVFSFVRSWDWNGGSKPGFWIWIGNGGGVWDWKRTYQPVISQTFGWGVVVDDILGGWCLAGMRKRRGRMGDIYSLFPHVRRIDSKRKPLSGV